MATSSECTYVTVHTEKSFIEWDYTICVHLKKKKEEKSSKTMLDYYPNIPQWMSCQIANMWL